MVDTWLGERQRWGTYSVRAHIDARALIADVLLFDALLLPTPATDDEFSRWEENGWQPELIAMRHVQLGDLAFPVPWEEELRLQWGERFKRLQELGAPPERLAFDTTAEMIARQSWDRVVDIADDRIASLKRPPELVAAFQDTGQARGDAWVVDIGATSPVTETDVGALIRWTLAVPEDGDVEETFHRAVHLAHDEKFQQSRHALFDWAGRVVEEKYTKSNAAFELDRLVRDYNNRVERQFAASGRRVVIFLVPIALGVAIDQLTGGLMSTLLGALSGPVVDGVKSRFPRLSAKHEDVSHHPGSAVARALAVLAHD